MNNPRRPIAPVPARVDGVRQRNAASVVKEILLNGPIARAEIAGRTGLSQGAVAKITAELINASIVVEAARSAATSMDPTLGRPRIPLALNREKHRFLGVHIGLDKLQIGLVDLTGVIVRDRAIAHRHRGPEAVLRQARQEVTKLLAAEDGVVVGAGVCAAGWVDPSTQTLVEHKGLGWKDVALPLAIPPELQVPIAVDSTVRALAIAEALFGVGRDTHDLLFVFIGSVIGSAHSVGGSIHRGRRAAAGTIDHLPVAGRGVACVCGGRNCLAALTNDAAVAAQAREAGLIGTDDKYEKLVELVRGPSPTRAALALMNRRARLVGSAVAILSDLFAPDVMALGGGILDGPDGVEQVRLGAEATRPGTGGLTQVIRGSALGVQAPMRGAASLALDAFIDNPLGTRLAS